MTRLLAVAVVLGAPLALAQGMLLPTDPALGPLGIKYQRVAAEIVDGTAVTTVEQVFVNSSPRPLEAHYVFPLPKGAALQGFYLWINGVKTRGEILEKEKASQIYEGIVRRLQDPGLLEYVDSEAFRARVFPVPANGEQRIQLTFSQVLDFSGGVYQYHYPLGASSRGAPRLPVRQDFTFSATLRSRIPLRSIYSPTHALGIRRKGEGEVVAGLEAGPGTDISRDLDLFYSVSEKAVGLTLLTQRADPEAPGFFVALLSPRSVVKAEEVAPKRVTFVIDTSGSMIGERLKLARDALSYCLQRLNPRDELNVVRFSTDVEALFERPQQASEATVKRALAFVAGLEAIGGTAIDEALTRALADGAGRGDRPHLVLFITDGHPTVGETDEAAIAARARAANHGSRIFTFGVGNDLDARLLDRVAEEGGGASDFVRDGREFEVKVSGFYDKVANPVLTELKLDLSAFDAFDVYPRRLGDLFQGGQLVVTGRYRTPKEAAVTLTGTVNGKRTAFEYRAEATRDGKQLDFVPRLWAIRKVGYLLEEIRLHGEKGELKDEVVALGKRYGIVTPYTSYLVVEDAPVARAHPGAPAPPPTPLPWASAPSPEDAVRGAGADFESARRPGPQAPPAREPAGSGLADKKDLSSADGAQGIAASQAVRRMKEEEVAGRVDEPVRTASGRTFLHRGGGWVDTEALAGTPRQLKVRYLSEAYFALLAARPDLKAALALSDRLVVVVAKDRSVIIEPGAGELRPEAVAAFLR
jgi:Ca-activated chloride channel homolog